jgi:hypothetical protein
MEVEISYVGIVLAALSTMVVGSIWYTPKVFGNTWMKLAKVKPEKNPDPKSMAILFGSAVFASLVTAYVLAHITFLSANFYEIGYLEAALMSGFWLWLGFTAARLYVHDAFEKRPRALTMMNATHELVTILVMALVYGLVFTI